MKLKGFKIFDQSNSATFIMAAEDLQFGGAQYISYNLLSSKVGKTVRIIGNITKTGTHGPSTAMINTGDGEILAYLTAGQPLAVGFGICVTGQVQPDRTIRGIVHEIIQTPANLDHYQNLIKVMSRVPELFGVS